MEQCVSDASDLLALHTKDSDAKCAVEAMQLTAAQACAIRALLLHGSLLSSAVTSAMGSLTSAALVANEPSAKVRVPVSIDTGQVS